MDWHSLWEEPGMFYKLAYYIVYTWLHARFRIRIKGLENIPEGGCILAMNHTSNYDPLLVGAHTPRKMHIMAKKELFANRLFSSVLKKIGAFPVNREGADIRSLRHSLKVVQEGNIFAIFIEGSRSKTGQMQIPKKGVGFIANKSGAPVVPTYIYGAKRGWRGRAGVTFGRPLSFGDETDYEAIANEIARQIQKLAQEEEGGQSH